WLLVDRVQYNDNSPWPEGADGDGPSLERSAPALYGNDPANWAASAQAGGTPGLPNSGTLVSTRAGWKFWDRGAGIDSAWTQPAFDDRTWQNGNAPLGYPDTDTEVDTPVSYGDDPAGKHVTTYFRTRFALGCSPADVSALTLRVRYDDGYVAYLNGQEVARGSMPAGTVAYGTLASTSGGSQGSYEEQNLLAGKDNLVQGLNVLAVEVHQVNATSSDLFFDLELTYRANEPQVDPPAAPSGLAAAPTVSGGIHLSWNDNSHDETAFKIDRRRSGESAWLRVATLGGNTSLWTDTGLAPETTYTYRVKAGNAGGDSAYAPAADATTFGADDELQSGAVWKYRKGTAEASDPPDAWRAVRFDDSDWPAGAAPIGYGEPEIVTALGDMQTSYSSLFLRTTFTIQHAALIHELGLWAHYDDGFIMWINGEEVARVNAAGAAGSFVPYDAFSAANVHATWSNTLAGTEMPALADGTNVVCVQLFNAALTSSDALFEAELSPRRSLLPAAEDADQDALPDAWEDAHFGGTGQATDGDPDGDGMSNHEEYIAGTDPLAKPAEAPPGEGGFGVDLQLANGSIVVSLPTVEATGSGYDGYSRHYALEQAGTGTGAAWSAVPGYEDILGAGQLIRYTNQSGTATIYRARVWLE
ncbi:MAG: fibronectin type III domain-containing protein, partial [Kiritimatiellae bacterium]|nr:fibronectin type III domain-containing protein [Kiritimatiellia bacterium]